MRLKRKSKPERFGRTKGNKHHGLRSSTPVENRHLKSPNHSCFLSRQETKSRQYISQVDVGTRSSDIAKLLVSKITKRKATSDKIGRGAPFIFDKPIHPRPSHDIFRLNHPPTSSPLQAELHNLALGTYHALPALSSLCLRQQSRPPLLVVIIVARSTLI